MSLFLSNVHSPATSHLASLHYRDVETNERVHQSKSQRLVRTSKKVSFVSMTSSENKESAVNFIPKKVVSVFLPKNIKTAAVGGLRALHDVLDYVASAGKFHGTIKLEA